MNPTFKHRLAGPTCAHGRAGDNAVGGGGEGGGPRIRKSGSIVDAPNADTGAPDTTGKSTGLRFNSSLYTAAPWVGSQILTFQIPDKIVVFPQRNTL